MNRYRSGGPSKATATTLCQKCLKRGHYTYECTSTQQDRPYVSRPSRTEQLSNPRLAPKLSATLPPVDPKPASTVEPSSKNSAVKAAIESRSLADDKSARPFKRRPRSISSHSSDSISSFSTNRSPSRSRTPPRATRVAEKSTDRYLSKSPVWPSVRRDRSPSPSAAAPGRHNPSMSPEPIRRSTRKEYSYSDRMPRHRTRSPLYQADRNDAQLRCKSRSRSRSPYRGNTGMPNKAAPERPGTASISQTRRPVRERSLSPYSQRLAMTKAMSG